jgi:hypothetical protein
VFRWRPWLREGRKEGTVAEGGLGNDSVDGQMTGQLKNSRGQWEVSQRAWGVLELVWPKPGTWNQRPLAERLACSTLTELTCVAFRSTDYRDGTKRAAYIGVHATVSEWVGRAA